MRVIKSFSLFTLFTLSLLLGSVSFSSERDDFKDIFKTVRKAYKMQRAERKNKEDSMSGVKEFELCIGCVQTKSLTKEVNKILFVLSEQEEKKNPKNQSLEAVEGLEAMFHYTMKPSVFGEKADCYKQRDGFHNSTLGDFEDIQSQIVFSKDIDLSKVEALHIRSGVKKTYYYRAKAPHRDIVVRLDIHGDDQAKITYYKMDMTKSLKAEIVSEKSKKVHAEKRKKTKKQAETWGAFSNGVREAGETDDDYADFGMGFSLEHKNNLPRKLTLLKGSSNTPITSDISFKSKAEVSSKRVGAQVSLADKKGEDYVSLRVKTDEAEIVIPTTIDLFLSDLVVEAEFSATTNEEQRMRFNLAGEQDRRTTLEFQNSRSGSSVALERRYQISNAQSFSVKLATGSDSESSAFLRYQLSF